MAKVESYTKEYIDDIERKVIVGGSVNGSGNLILKNGQGQDVDAGNVQGDLPGRIDTVEETLTEIDTKSKQVPRAPVGFEELENTGFYEDGRAKSRVLVAWLPVILDVYDHDIEIPEYEIWVDGQPVLRVSEPRGSVVITATATSIVRVRAFNASGVPGDLSADFEVTGALPIFVERSPSDPVLSSGAGNVFSKFDGSYDVSSVGAGVVAVQARLPDQEWTHISYVNGAGETLIRLGTVGDTVQVRHQAFDMAGRSTGYSQVKTITIIGVPISDLDSAVTDFLNDLDDKANSAVVSFVEEYAVNTSNEEPPESGWSTDQPTHEPGKTVWKRTIYTHTDSSITTGIPAVLPPGADGEDAVLLRVSSSRGTAFKNSAISTVLTVTVFKGAIQITNITDLRYHLGLAAYLEWWWRRIDDTEFGVISSADSRLSESGFAFTVSPADVDEQTVFQCILHV